MKTSFVFFAIFSLTSASQLFEIQDGNHNSIICDSESVVYCKRITVFFDTLDEESFEAFNTTFIKDHEIANEGASHSVSHSYTGNNGTAYAVITELKENNMTVVYGKLSYDTSDASTYAIRKAIEEDHLLIQFNHTIDDLDNDVVITEDGDPEANRALLGLSDLNRNTVYTYSLTLYYTNLLKSSEGNMQTYFDQLVAELNDGYIRTQVPIRAKIHCILQSLMTESGRNQYSSPLTTIYTLYGNSNANIVRTADLSITMTRYGQGNSCGTAYLGPYYYKHFGYSADECNFKRTFDHEIGHLLGLCHNRQAGCSSNVPYAWGWMIPNTPYRTIMSYNSDGNHPTRIGYYSNDDYTVNGQPMGDASNDNRRRLTEVRSYISGLGNESDKSCSASNCEDQYSFCPGYVRYCQYYSSLRNKYCRKTCNNCD